MSLSRRRFVQGACLAAPSLAVQGQKPVVPPMPAEGSVFRLGSIPLLDGGRFEPAQVNGKVLVLYWWASWCPFCALQSPEMQKLWDAQRARGLQMLGLSIDKKPEEAVSYLKKKAYTFPSAWMSPEVARFYPKPDGLPVTIVIGKDGRVAQTEKGQLFPEDVEQLARWL
ncbi:MAG: TlpA family protein disulfide reductase [Comamonadaceae bacterium]|nr:TlpA family protein disulfide reductase [Comamonadaceae bacterium]